MFGVVAQGQPAADQAKKAWKLDFESWSDPQVEIAAHMNACGMAHIHIDTDLAENMNSTGVSGGLYQAGLTQPAIVVVPRGSPKAALVSWSSVPSSDNIGGATGRPSAKETLAAVEAALAGEPGYEKWAPESTLGQKLPIPYPVFLLALFANGNFIRPGYFILDANGEYYVGHKSRGHPMVWALGKSALAVGGSVALAATKRGRVAGGILGLWAAWGAYVYIVHGDSLRKGFKLGAQQAEQPRQRISQSAQFFTSDDDSSGSKL